VDIKSKNTSKGDFHKILFSTIIILTLKSSR